jgi:hypothetical protein
VSAKHGHQRCTMSNIIPHNKINPPCSTTVRLANCLDFTMTEGLWCPDCGQDLRAIDAEVLDNDGGVRLICRDCGHQIFRSELRL